MKHLLNILTILSITLSLQAHNQNEINYNIYRENGQWQLTVHLTPQTVLAAIEHLHPALRGEAVIRIPDYQADLVNYLQENISIQFDAKAVSMDFQKADLLAHDGYAHFLLPDAPESFEQYYVEIQSFRGLFRRTINRVILVKDGHASTCVLTGNQVACASGDFAPHAVTYIGFRAFAWPLLLILTLYFLYRCTKVARMRPLADR